MSRQPEKYFHTTLLAISILVLAVCSEQVSAGHLFLNTFSEDIQDVTLITDDGVKVSKNYYFTKQKRLLIILNDLFVFKDIGFNSTFRSIQGSRYPSHLYSKLTDYSSSGEKSIDQIKCRWSSGIYR